MHWRICFVSTTPQPQERDDGVLHFATRVAQGDVVIAASGDQVLGVGRVTGEYIYQSDTEFPIAARWSGSA